jgi:hypothetical protein
MMRSARAIFMVVLVAGLGVYALDCFAASTPDEAMQCCGSMPCPHDSGDGSQDCCQTMPSLHAPFVRPHTVDNGSHAPVVLAYVPALNASQGLDFFASIQLAAHSHAPPPPTAASMPLRI